MKRQPLIPIIYFSFVVFDTSFGEATPHVSASHKSSDSQKCPSYKGYSGAWSGKCTIESSSQEGDLGRSWDEGMKINWKDCKSWIVNGLVYNFGGTNTTSEIINGAEFFQTIYFDRDLFNPHGVFFRHFANFRPLDVEEFGFYWRSEDTYGKYRLIENERILKIIKTVSERHASPFEIIENKKVIHCSFSKIEN